VCACGTSAGKIKVFEIENNVYTYHVFCSVRIACVEVVLPRCFLLPFL
jgi:hypothetical protein